MRFTTRYIFLAVCCPLLVFVGLGKTLRTEIEVTDRHLANALTLIDHSLPYYSPTLESTVNWSERPFVPDNVQYFGTPLNMVIASDISRTVIGIINGKIAWSRKYPGIWPRAMDFHEGMLYVGNRRSIDVVDYRNGKSIATIEVPAAPEQASINGIRLSRIKDVVYFSIAFDIPGKDSEGSIISGKGSESAASIMIYRLIEGSPSSLKLAVADINGAHYPRDALLIDGGYLVADTYWHRVYFVQYPNIDLKSAMSYADVSVFYPNTVDIMKSGSSKEVIVAAEHENRVFSINLITGEKRLLMHCPYYPFNNPALDAKDISRNLSLTTAQETGGGAPKSRCATEYSGLWTLYSPNSARAYKGKIIIADTDNHMVKVIDENKMLALVVGIPNPVNALLF